MQTTQAILVTSDIVDMVLSHICMSPTKVTNVSNCAVCEWILPDKRMVMHIKPTDANLFIRSTFIVADKSGTHDDMVMFANQHLR